MNTQTKVGRRKSELPRGVRHTGIGKYKAVHNNKTIAVFDTIEDAKNCYVELVKKLRRESWVCLGGGVSKLGKTFYGYSKSRAYVGKFLTEKEAREAVFKANAQHDIVLKKRYPRCVVELENGKFQGVYKGGVVGEFDNSDDAHAAIEALKTLDMRSNFIYLGDGITYNKSTKKHYLHIYDPDKKRAAYQGTFATEAEARAAIADVKLRMAAKKRKPKSQENVIPINAQSIKRVVPKNPAQQKNPAQVTHVCSVSTPTSVPTIGPDRVFYDFAKKCYSAVARGRLYENIKSSEEARGIVNRGRPFEIKDKPAQQQLQVM